jgi:putative tryptophan/tyrosine transport system substrate-binding protein
LWTLSRCALIACISALLVSACSQGGGEAPAAQTRTVLYLGTLVAEQEQRTLASLRRELQRLATTVGPVVVVHKHLGSAESSDEALLRNLTQAYSAHEPDLVFAATPRVARLAQNHDGKTPIVFEGSSDPRLNCLVDDLVRPGRNATGYVAHVPLAGKMLEALWLAYPSLTEVVILSDGGERRAIPCHGGQRLPDAIVTCHPGWLSGAALDDVSPAALEAIEAVRAAKLPLRVLRLCEAADYEQLAHWLGGRPAGTAPRTGVLVPMQYLFYVHTQALIATLAPLAWPTVYPRWRWTQLGGLMAVSPTAENYPAERAAEVVVRLLSGARTQETPVQLPDGVQWYFNARVAHDQGLQPERRALKRVYRFVP